MGNFSELFAPLAISQLLLLGAFLLSHYRGLLARLVALFCLCLIAYVLLTMGLFSDNFLATFILLRLATASPFVIWLIAYLLFVDGGRIRRAIWGTMAFFFLARALGEIVVSNNPESLNNVFLLLFADILPQLVMLAFSVHSIVLASYGYQDDLIVRRRQFRVLFVLLMAAIVVAVLGIGALSRFQDLLAFELIGGLSDFPSSVYTAYMFFVSLLLNIQAFKLSDEAMSLIPEDSVLPIHNGSKASHQNQADPALVRNLEKLMQEEKLYSQPGLTIAELAERLSIQEYKLRRLINQSMNYRNFNQFLNNYRIEEASKILLSSDSPISSIALDVGYSSLSVFNKAFKERFNMTPTEYRSTRPPKIKKEEQSQSSPMRPGNFQVN